MTKKICLRILRNTVIIALSGFAIIFGGVFSSAVAAPQAPYNIYVTIDSGTQVTLNWTDNYSDHVGYLILRGPSSNGPFAIIATIADLNISSYIDTGLNDGQAYYYKVAAYDGSSPAQSTSSNAYLAVPSIPPGSPQSLTATATGTSSINLSWRPPSSGADPVTPNNKVLYYIYKNGSKYPLNFSPISATSYTDAGVGEVSINDGTQIVANNSDDTGLEPARTYYYQVRAVDINNAKSDPTPVVSATTATTALTAVIKVNETRWYTDNKNGALGGASLTNWFAPLPVFFEGWRSSPRRDIVEYKWDFGDGSDLFYGFNAAHVYEVPGTYTCILTVKDKTGSISQATQSITVRPRDGKPKYYVDSSTLPDGTYAGDDSFDGLVTAEDPGYNKATGHGPWRTADKAFLRLYQPWTLGVQYTPGTQVLFKRGQTFDVTSGLVYASHWQTGSGWLFGAYGAGSKPIIKLKSITGMNTIFYINGVGISHATFQDLVFDCSTAAGQRASFFFDSCEATDLLFLRVDINNVDGGFTFSGARDGAADDSGRVQSGIFIIGSTMSKSNVIQNFATASRVALLNNNFDLAGNHTNYLAYLNCGVISGNVFSRPAFGRAALRIDGSKGPAPTNNVYISKNNFLGWVDPIDGFPAPGWNDPASVHYDPYQAHNGGGNSYNYHLIYFAPNVFEEQFMQDVLFENNTATNAERFFFIGDYENLIIRNNTFYTPDDGPAHYRFELGFHFDNRPLKNIQITNNVIDSNEDRTSGSAGVFGIFEYSGPAYALRTLQEGIVIQGNTLAMRGTKANRGRYLYYNVNDSLQMAQVNSGDVMGDDLSCANKIYANTDQQLIQVGGNSTVSGTLYSLGSWQSFTAAQATIGAKDKHTSVVNWGSSPLAGVPAVAASSPTTPVNITYSGAQPNATIYLWVKKDTDIWQKTNLYSVSDINGSGTFRFGDNSSANGTYYFALQADDNLGHVSPPPAGLGQASTIIQQVTLPQPQTYTLGIASTNGAVSASPSKPNNIYNAGDVVTLTVVADTGYSFVNWTGDVTGTASSVTITMDANKTVIAHCAAIIPTYTVTNSVWLYGGGTISPATTTLNAGSSLAVTLTPASSSFYLLDVLDNGVSVKNQLSAGVSGSLTYTLNNISDNHAIIAQFSAYTYTVTALSGPGGVISSYTGASTPVGGGTITITSTIGASPQFSIIPNTGYKVADVFLDGVSIGAVTSCTFSGIVANHTLSAAFSPVITSYGITAAAGANGAISPAGITAVNSGASQAFSIVADSGYKIASVLVDGVSVGPVSSYIFNNIISNHTISANFTALTYTVTATSGAGGIVSSYTGVNTPIGGGTITITSTIGASPQFSIIPNTGYKIVDVLVDGISKGAISSYTFSNIGVNHTIGATFSLALPTAPANLTAIAVSSSQINLSWKDNSNNEAGFKIWRSANANSASFTQVATLGADAAGYSNTGLSAGKTYYYKVCAYNASGSSAYTAVVSATTNSAVNKPVSIRRR